MRLCQRAASAISFPPLLKAGSDCSSSPDFGGEEETVVKTVQAEAACADRQTDGKGGTDAPGGAKTEEGAVEEPEGPWLPERVKLTSLGEEPELRRVQEIEAV